MSLSKSIDSQTNSIENINSLRLPQFWVSQPEIWFTQVEAQFSILRISLDRTKYNLILSNLPLEIISKIYDIITNPPEKDLYNNLKDTLIKRLSLSEEGRLEELLSGSELGDSKPSDFYRHMLNIVGGSQVVSSDLLIKLWQRRLPKTILVALTASGKKSVQDLLDIADKIWETYSPSVHSNTISSVRNEHCLQPLSSNQTIPEQLIKSFNDFSISCQNIFQNMTQKHQSLELQINSLQNQITHRSRSDFQCRSCRARSRSTSQRRNTFNKNSICWYHNRYKNKARFCSGSWCTFKNSLNSDCSKNE